jgi:predicted GTPase/thymidine kinase
MSNAHDIRFFKKPVKPIKKVELSNSQKTIDIPPENINISLLGSVSTGKSTVLNAIFCHELSQSSLKRTTMNPFIFVENNNIDNTVDMSKDIHRQISEINKDIVKKTEQGYKQLECDEMIFNVGKIDIKILDNSLVNLIDVPGLNDARTKTIYFNYLKENFFNFNIIIFLVDIQSGLNTSDEMDILKMIVNETQRELSENGRKMYTLVVVNKCDDLQEGMSDINGNKPLVLVGELQEMFEQVQNTVKGEFKDLTQHLIGVIPLCGIDAFLYRMVKKHGSTYQLKDTDIVKIGTAEGGKRFSRKSMEEQRAEVMKIIADEEFVKSMIKMSGFSGLETALSNFLISQNKGNELRISNIEFNMKTLPDITSEISKKGNVLSIVEEYNKFFDNIKKIDIDQYHRHIAMFISSLNKGYKNVVETMKDVFTIKSFYDEMNEMINKKFFAEFSDTKNYPSFVKEKTLKIIKDKFGNGIIDIGASDKYIAVCRKCFNN